MNDPMMDSQQVADYLKIAHATVVHWAKAGKLPAMKIGKFWRFRRHDIETWLDQQAAPEKATVL